jgi:hypothetical protein
LFVGRRYYISNKPSSVKKKLRPENYRIKLHLPIGYNSHMISGNVCNESMREEPDLGFAVERGAGAAIKSAGLSQ